MQTRDVKGHFIKGHQIKLGVKHTDEAKRKMSISHLKNPSRYWLGKKRPDISEQLSIVNKGKVLSVETRQKMSGSKKGEKSYLWRGGIATHERKLWHNNQRRVKKIGNGGSHTQEQWEALKKLYNYMCLCCKQQEPFIKLTRDHITPLTSGGKDDIENIQPLCFSCNSKKYTKIINFIEKVWQ